MVRHGDVRYGVWGNELIPLRSAGRLKGPSAGTGYLSGSGRQAAAALRGQSDVLSLRTASLDRLDPLMDTAITLGATRAVDAEVRVKQLTASMPELPSVKSGEDGDEGKTLSHKTTGKSRAKKKKKRRKKSGDGFEDEDDEEFFDDVPKKKKKKPKKKEEIEEKEEFPVSELREMPPVQAVRHAMLHRAGSLKDAWREVDLNGNGLLSVTEFQDGLSALRIPWKELTGLDDIRDLFGLFDADGSGEVDLEEFIGYPQEADTDWRKLDEDGAWKNYITKVKMAPSTLTRMPRWEKVMMEYQKGELDKQRDLGDPDAARMKMRSEILEHGTEHPEVKKYRLGMLDEVEIQRTRRMQQTQLDDQRRKMDHALKELQSSRSEFVKIKSAMVEVANEDVRIAKEKEQEKQRVESAGKFGGMGLGLGGGGGILGRQKTPTPEMLVAYFTEAAPDLGLTEEELKIREIARNLEIPIPEVEKVKKVFDKYDEDGSGEMEKDEFKQMLSELICVGRLKGLEVPSGMLDDHWRSVDHDGSGEVDFDEFAEWYLLSFMPMQARNRRNKPGEERAPEVWFKANLKD